MTDQAELHLDDLNKLRDLYEEHSAASDELDARRSSMTIAEIEDALESLTAKARAIETFEFNHPHAASAFWSEHD